MKTVIQRVSRATLDCEDFHSEIGLGLVVYFGVERGDKQEDISKIAKKIVDMRIFSDENGKMNLSVKNVNGEILAVSQFTLLANLSRGNRPSFEMAESPIIAKEFYDRFILELRNLGVVVKTGVFGKDMHISQVNEGPVTIIYEVK